MVTIIDPKEDISQLWGHPELKDTDYRLMRYLLRVEVEEGVLLHNVVTGHLILLTKEEVEMLFHLPQEAAKKLRDLVFHHFLVPDDFDEYRSVNQLRLIYQRSRTSNGINHYVILPTTFCNAHCFYCYESDYPHVHMTETTANRVIEYISENRNGKDVEINWFGGEPLVGIQRIDQISQGLMERGIPFTASMVSNGYLFDENTVERSVNLWKLKRIQITLDGTEDIYNQVKAYRNAQDNPFQRVLRNIDLLSGKQVYVNIRLNVDFYNKDDIRTLIDLLGRKYFGNQYVKVYLNMLFNNQGFEPVTHSFEDMVTLSDLIDEYTIPLKESQLYFDRLKLPYLAISQCMADNPNSIMIQPDGSFCRCEHENILDSYGSINDGIFDPIKFEKWKETVERSEKCPECSVYPACFHLRFCMDNDMPCIDHFRLKYMEKQRERLKVLYSKKMEEKTDESI